MKQSELVRNIAKRTSFNQSEVGAVIKTMVSELTTALTQGDSINIVDLGTLSAKSQAARKGRNPRTGESIEISERMAPKFKASTVLKETING